MNALSNDLSDDFSTELTSNSIILVTYPLANGPAFHESLQGSSDLSARPVSNSGKNRMEFPRDKIGTVTFNRSQTVLIAILIAFVLVLYVMLLVKKKNMSLSQQMSFYSSLTVAQVFPPFIPATHASSLLANLIDSQGIHFLIVYVIVTKNV